MHVAIVGGGMSGATLALALNHLTAGQMKISLVEATSIDAQSHPGFDARAIALAEGTVRSLKRLNLWDYFRPKATPIKQITVTDQHHFGRTDMSASDYHTAALGYVVELHQVGQSLWQAIKQTPAIDVYCPYEVSSYQKLNNCLTLQLSPRDASQAPQALASVNLATTELTADLVIAADGGHSALAKLANIPREISDYGQSAIIANVKTSEPHILQAFEHFTEQGPLALLPMSEERYSLVWCCHHDQLQHRLSLDDDQFLAELQKAFGWRLGAFIQTGKRSAYPLRLNKTRSHITHRIAFVGNAAQTLHPIAGQGFNLGMRDLVAMAETISSAFKQGEDIGSQTVLMRYLKRRKADQRATIGLTNLLVKTFSNNQPHLVLGRNLALTAMQISKSLRDQVAHRTLGWIRY